MRRSVFPSNWGQCWLEPVNLVMLRPAFPTSAGVSIIDVQGGHQPIANEDQTVWTVLNGEIYNFGELRDELCSAGVEFRGRSDTEVLLRAYERWGEGAFERLNGMWALALCDGAARKLVVSRDRFGIKPLYCTAVDGAWVFASEVKALLPFPGAFRGFSEANITEVFLRIFADRRNVSPGDRRSPGVALTMRTASATPSPSLA